MDLFKNGSLVSSDILEKNADEDGFFFTTEDNQIINFTSYITKRNYDLHEICIYAKDTPLSIKINDSEGILHIDNYSYGGISDKIIQNIQVMGKAGQQLRYEGLFISSVFYSGM